MCSHFKPQPSNLFPQIYLLYLWHFATVDMSPSQSTCDCDWSNDQGHCDEYIFLQPSKDLNGGEEVLDGDLHVVHKSLTLLYRAITWLIRSNQKKRKKVLLQSTNDMHLRFIITENICGLVNTFKKTKTTTPPSDMWSQAFLGQPLKGNSMPPAIT